MPRRTTVRALQSFLALFTKTGNSCSLRLGGGVVWLWEFDRRVGQGARRVKNRGRFVVESGG